MCSCAIHRQIPYSQRSSVTTVGGNAYCHLPKHHQLGEALSARENMFINLLILGVMPFRSKALPSASCKTIGSRAP